MSGRSWPMPCPGYYSFMHWNLMMDIPNELEGLEDPDHAPEAEEPKPKSKRKPKAPPAPPPTPEELAASAARLQAICEQVRQRDEKRERDYVESIQSRMTLERMDTRTHTPQIYWAEDGWMRCGTCHQCSDHKAPEDLRRCMGHFAGHLPRSTSANREETARQMREEDERRRAARIAGRIAGREDARARRAASETVAS